MSDSTLAYYDDNAATFFASTVQADMTAHYTAFLQHLKPNANILDLGCGSGRDSKFFIDNGYAIEAIDGSLELCKIASEHIGKPVRHLEFEELDYTEAFDAVWACSSLLHIPKEKLHKIFLKINHSLKKHGILYSSFKYGHFSGERNGRFFTDLTEQDFNQIIDSTKCFSIVEMTISYDVRPDRSGEKWLNTIIRKIL